MLEKHCFVYIGTVRDDVYDQTVVKDHQLTSSTSFWQEGKTDGMHSTFY